MKLHLLLAGAVLVGMGAGTAQAVKAPRVPPEEPGQRGQRTELAKPVLARKTYTVPGGDAQDIAQVLQGIYNRNPSVAVSAVGPNTILALAPAQDQAALPAQPGVAPPKPASGNHPPVSLTAVGNRLIVASEEPRALALVTDLVPLLTAPRAGEGDYEVIRLRSASAVEAAKVLDELFNGPPAGPGPGRSRQERIRVVADPASNSLLVRAAPLDQLVIRRLVRAPLDTVEPAEAPARRIQVIGLKHAHAPELVKVIREVYRDAERALAITADVRSTAWWSAAPRRWSRRPAKQARSVSGNAPAACRAG